MSALEVHCRCTGDWADELNLEILDLVSILVDAYDYNGTGTCHLVFGYLDEVH